MQNPSYAIFDSQPLTTADVLVKYVRTRASLGIPRKRGEWGRPSGGLAGEGTQR